MVSPAAFVANSDVPPHRESKVAAAARWSGRLGWTTVGTLAILVAIVAVAMALRFVGLDWGRPFVYHPDESVLVNPAMTMIRTGSWNPNSFTYPSALIYVERFIVGILHFTDPTVSLSTDTSGGFAGLASRSGPNALIEQFPYFFAGRAFVATVGALMAVPTYFAARAVSNTVGAVAAAIAIAIAPLAVANSQYLTTDVPTAALTVLTLWLSLRGLTGGRRWLLAAGFVAGLAASTKYNGGLVVIVPLVVLLTSCPPRQLLRRPTLTTAGLIVLASMAGFALLTPAVVFDLRQVWAGGILYQLHGYSSHPGSQGTDNFIYYLRVLWGDNAIGLGAGLSILAALGLLISVLRHRRADLAILSFVIAYYFVVSLPPVRFDRNLLPLMPFLAVLVGQAVGWLVELLATRSRRITGRLGRLPAIAAGLALIVVAATPSYSLAVAIGQAHLRTDTRTLAFDWIEANIPHGATIAREEFTPQISNSDYRVGDAGYLLANKPLAWYKSVGFEYVIASSFQFDRYKGIEPQDSFYRSLLAEPIVMDIRPQPGRPGPRVVMVRLSAASQSAGAP